MKIVFNDLNTSYNYIELSIDGGLTWTQYLVSDVIESGIALDDEQEYDKLKIRGSNSVIDSFHVYKNIEIPEHHTFIGVYENIAELENTPNLPYDNDFAFVIEKDELGNEILDRYRYNGLSWIFEYSLNNNNFTKEQWDSINSTITKAWREQVDSNLTDLLSELDNKSDSTHTHSNYEPISSTETITSSTSKTPSTTVKYIITSNNVTLTLNKANVKAGITVMVVAAVACKVTYYKHNSSSSTTMSLAADTMETFISTGNGYVASKTSQMWLT